jgi:hypothetical protein
MAGGNSTSFVNEIVAAEAESPKLSGVVIEATRSRAAIADLPGARPTC